MYRHWGTHSDWTIHAAARPYAKPDARLVKLLLTAYRFNAVLTRGKTPPPSPSERASVGPTSRLVRLSYIALDITQAILDGRQPRDLTPEKLLEHSRLPLAWHAQRIALGFGWAGPSAKIHRTIELNERPDYIGTEWHSRRSYQRHCGTGSWRDRDIAAGWRDLERPCASQSTQAPSRPPTAARKAQVLG